MRNLLKTATFRGVLPAVIVALSFGTAVTTLSAQTTASSDKEKKELKVGDVAPDFELKGTDGKTYKLSDFKGKSPVVVAWYPKALTGG